MCKSFWVYLLQGLSEREEETEQDGVEPKLSPFLVAIQPLTEAEPKICLNALTGTLSPKSIRVLGR